MSNLGVRNNNWLNIRYNPENDWVGQTGGDANGYTQFTAPVYGLRAADRVLQNYGEKHGIETLNQAIFRFAPPSDNNPTSGYTRFVADQLGISPNDKINLSDPNTRGKMIEAMVKFETPDAVGLYNPSLLEEARSIDENSGIPSPTNNTQSINPNTQAVSSEFITNFFSDAAATPQTDDRYTLEDGTLNIAKMIQDDAVPEVGPLPSAGLVDGFIRGARSGSQQILADGYMFGAGIDALQGDESEKQDSIRNARLTEELSSIPMQGMETFGEFLEEKTVEGFFDQVAQGSGQVLPSMISSIVGFIAGGGVASIGVALGKQAVTQSGRSAAKELIKESVEAVRNKTATPDQKKIAQAAYEAAKEAAIVTGKVSTAAMRQVAGRVAGTGNAFKKGGLAGAFASEYVPLSGSNISEALESGRELDKANALRAYSVGVPQATIGVLGEVGLVKLLAGQAAKKSAGPNSVMGRLADTFGKKFLQGGAIGATTEFLQEEIAIQNRQSMDDTFSDADANLRRQNALFLGFFAQGGLAATGATAIQGVKELGNIDASGALDTAAKVTERATEMAEDIKDRFTGYRAQSELTDTDGVDTVAEADFDINAQLGAMINDSSEKSAVWVAGNKPYSGFNLKNNRIARIFLGEGESGKEAFAAFVPGRGTIISTDRNVVNEVIKGEASDSVLAAALGYSNVKTDADSIVVRAYDSFGGIVSEESTTPDKQDAAWEAAGKLMPEGGRREIVPIDEALADRKRRSGPDVQFMQDETVGDQEFESEVTTYTYTKGGQQQSEYKAAEGENNFEGINEDRQAWSEITEEDIDWTNSEFSQISQTTLKTATRLQRENPNEVVRIVRNENGSYRIDIETTPDTQRIRMRNDRGETIEVSIDEFIRRSLTKASQSKSEYRTFTITFPDETTSENSIFPFEIFVPEMQQMAQNLQIINREIATLETAQPEASATRELGRLRKERDQILQDFKNLQEQKEKIIDGEITFEEVIRRSRESFEPTTKKTTRTISVNPVDLMNAGRRLMEAQTGTFAGGGSMQSARDGLLAMLSELAARGYKLEVNGVPLNIVLENLANPRKELLPDIANITVGFRANGERITLEKLLTPYVPGGTNYSRLVEVELDDGSIVLREEELAREESQDETGPTDTEEISVESRRTFDGIPLTDLDRQTGDPVPQPKGDAVASIGQGPAVKITQDKSFKSGIAQPFGEISELFTRIIGRLAKTIKLQTPVAFIGLKEFGLEIQNQFLTAVKPEFVGNAYADIEGKISRLDLPSLRDPEAIGKWLLDTYKKGQLIPVFDQYMTEAEKTLEAMTDEEAKSDIFFTMGYTFLLRAAFEAISPFTSNEATAADISKALVEHGILDQSIQGWHKAYAGGTVIMINNMITGQDARTVMTGAHELGHALFKEEIKGVLENAPLFERLVKAFKKDRQRARDDGTPIAQWEEADPMGTAGFEEWYADQVAAWTKEQVSGAAERPATNQVESHFKKLAQRFMKMWEALKTSFFNTRMGELAPSFAEYMEGVKEARRSNREYKAKDALGRIRGTGVADYGSVPDVDATQPEATQPDEIDDPVEVTGDDTAAQEVPPNTQEGGDDSGGRSGDGMGVPHEPSWEQKAIVAAVKREVAVLTGSAARAAAWRRKFQEWSREFLKKNPNALKIMGLIFTSDSTLRWAAGNEVADMFYIRSNTKGGLGFVQARQLARDKWRAELFKVLGNDWTTEEVQNALKEAQGSTATADLTGKAKEIRELLETMHREYVEPSNSNIGFRPNYFPVLLNLMEIMNDPEAFIEMVYQADLEAGGKADKASIKKVVDRLVKYQQMIDEDEVDPATLDIVNPGAAVEASLELTKNVAPSIMRDMKYVQEPEVALLSYIDNITKRVEWNTATRTADGKDRLQDMLANLPKKNKETAEAVINAYLGNVTHLSPFWRKANSYLQAMNLVTLLPFAVFASIPDFAGAIVQTKEFNGFGMFLKEIGRQIKDREEAKRFANDIGVVMPEAAANAWMSQLDSDMLDPTVRRATDKFFEWTGLTFLTTLSREFASGMAKRFLIEHANNPTARSERYLKTLGVTYDQVRQWEANNFSFEGENGEAVKAALQRFVESSVLRPNSAERPIWASDPRFALIWQLKSFVYAFNKVILSGIEREIGQRILSREGFAASMGPLLMLTMIAFMPLAALGLELREYAKVGLSYALPGIDGSLKYLRSDKMDYGTYFSELFSRAGLDGPIGLLTMAQRSGDYGGSALASLLGPSAELIEVGITDGPFDMIGSRMNSPQELTGTILGAGAFARALIR